MSLSDITLLERWQDRRDAKAFQELVSRHGGMVYAASSRILRNAGDAEEVAQECFLALAQAKAGNIRLLGGWLHTLGDHIRARRLDQGLFQRDVAKLVGVCTDTVTNWEKTVPVRTFGLSPESSNSSGSILAKRTNPRWAS